MRAEVAVSAAALIAATFLAYVPVLQAGFVWDDEAHVTAPALRSLSGLARIWTDLGATQQYYPLLHTAFWVEHRLWGDAALGYHLANLAFHAAAAGMFALVLRTLAIPGALLAALLFAVHPVHVESVAWIAEQKNTLSTLLYLSAAFVYLRFDAERRPRQYVVASVLFAMALLTKTVTATLPAALLVVSWWRRGRLEWRRDIRPLVPWLLVGALAGSFTAWIERHLIGAQGAEFALSMVERGLLAGRVIWFYLAKLVWPADLTFIYPRWEIDAAGPWQWLPLGGALAVAALLWSVRKRTRAPLAAFLFFTGSLFPVLGFFDVYPFRYSFVADHFQYLPSLGVLAVVSAAWMRLRLPMIIRGALAILVLLALGILTGRQTQTYRDAETLYRATVERNPTAWMAWNNLGKELQSDRARLPEAIGCFERALALRPLYPEAHNNLGLALTQVGRPVEAIPHLAEAARLKPDWHQTFNNLGIALASSGRIAESLEAFQRAAALNPRLPNIHENWGKALLLAGRREEAEARFAEAARLRGAR